MTDAGISILHLMSEFDVVVVGGGAAGLSAALVLSRARRRVAVVDAGHPRNAPAAHMHGFLSRDGLPPDELLAMGREEVRGYGGHIIHSTVVGAVRGTGSDFELRLSNGSVLRARRLVVATGLRDVLPDIPGVGERFGRDVLHCPYCHGWEVRDRAIAVLATSPMAGHQALLFRQLSDDVVVVVHDGVELPDKDVEKLDAIGVRFTHGTPREVVTDGDALIGLRLADDSVLERDAIVVASKPHVRADFLGPIGIEPTPFEMNGVALGSVIAVEPATGATSVPGIFAAGNATDIAMILIASAAHGTRVGAWINAELANADAAEAVRSYRADFSEQPA